MDSGLSGIMEGYHRTFWSAAATLPQCLPEPTALGITGGSAKGHKPAPALDLATPLFQVRALWPGESAVAAARVKP